MKSTSRVLLGVLVLAIIVYAIKGVLDHDKPIPIDKGAYFSDAEITQIIDGQDYDSIRFYNAVYPENSPMSVLAVATLKESEAGRKYFLFEKIVNGKPQYKSLSKTNAKLICGYLGEANSFSASFSKKDIKTILTESKTEGISVTQTSDSSGNKTMQIVGAYLDGNDIKPVSGSSVLMDKEPCPLACGANPSKNYLCQ